MTVHDVDHVIIRSDKNLVCHWPRQGGLWRWGKEMLAGFIESPCSYESQDDVGHGQTGIWANGYVRLRRSMDAGQSWQDGGVLFDNSRSVEAQRDTLHLDDYEKDGGRSLPREIMNETNSDTVLMMGRAWCGDKIQTTGTESLRKNVAYCYRSRDRGRNWENVPSIIWPNHTETVVELANNSLQCSDGRLLSWLVGFSGIEGATLVGDRIYSPQLYASEDHGQSWHFYSEIYTDPHGRIAASYPQVLALPSGRWMCSLGCWYQAGGARMRWTSLSYSDDQGLNWSEPYRIHTWSVSPFPLLLEDGRIVIIYMRRNPDPTGLFAIVSENEGKSWSAPVALRTDTLEAGPRGVVDGGYPVAVDMGDNRVFVSYYWQHNDPDVPWYGGRKYIAGTYFRL